MLPGLTAEFIAGLTGRGPLWLAIYPLQISGTLPARWPKPTIPPRSPGCASQIVRPTGQEGHRK